MSNSEQLVAQLRANPKGVRFVDLEKVCREFFGVPRRADGTHMVFKTPWLGNPRINIQNDHQMAKPYQVRQVLSAIDKLAEQARTEKTEEEQK